MKNDHQVIAGSCFSDERGTVSFINGFSFDSIVRFYEISPKDTSVIRAWQAHKFESKWFYCTQGAFKVNLIKLDSIENPLNVSIFSYELKADNTQVLFIPGGYATGFKALFEGSKLMVFSDFNLEASKLDDYRFDINKWKINW